MSDIHALSGAYAVDALDALERGRFERHLDVCGTCRSEVQSLTESVVLLSQTTATTPPAHLRGDVLDAIATVRPMPPVVATVAARSARQRRRFPLMVAAACAAGVIGVGAAVTQPWADDRPTQGEQLSAADRVLDASDSQTYSTELDGGGKVSFTRSSSLNQAVVQASDLEMLPDAQTYELWLIHDGVMKKAGLIRGGSATAVLEGAAKTADGAGITIEPAGGSFKPSDDVVVLVNFDES